MTVLYPSKPRAESASAAIWPALGVAAVAGAGPAALGLIGLTAMGPASVASAVAASLGAAAVFAWRFGRASPDGAAIGLEPAPAAESSVPVPPGPPYAAMLDLIADPILLVQGGDREDLSGRRFVFANAAARSLLRIQRQEAPLTTAIRAPEVLDAVDDALYAGVDGEAEYVVRSVQDQFWRARAVPLAASQTRAASALLILRDETEVRRGERARADFLANASHELRTPLASLSGFIETLRGHAKEDPEARDRFLAIMQTQAERMRRLIDDLMSLSRIEQGEHIAPSGAVDTAVAVIDVLDALAPLAKERCVTFQPTLPPRGAAIVTGDRDQILQVIQNLVENAIKYTPTGSAVTIEVLSDLTSSQVTAPATELAAHFSILKPDHASGRRYVAVRVRDHGPGIGRNHLPRLAERFYRVEGQKPRERPGTGLGLAIVKHIVNRHRGGLIVESTEGAGARFTAYVPMFEPAAVADETAAPAPQTVA